ncbi:hypothetical protein DUZ99_02030 [Xylanibacillus composti]|uniref:Rho termination factor N-terminal domain-containing protein n=1 Tax=Xylanibacillus composti TaxID=1572762 RepID=A0A8J4H6U2_9BACL|nr:hypothetical protein [Xylanibacillus composti]MDT9723773.1 hypothetical protein [Xylanibacillus composti]GIQ70756.1 hypothetical protein XYCOK13_35800 [Xylanibacillus composti]
MGLTTFNRMRRARAVARLAEEKRLAAERLAAEEAARVAEEEAERLRKEEVERKAAEEAARLEAERQVRAEGKSEDVQQPDFFAPEFHGTQPSSEGVEDTTEQGDAVEEVSFNELRARAKELRIEGYGKMKMDQLAEAVAAASVQAEG